ncbi:IS701 family transposase [Leptolyngbya ohadii]|uniref:IS701 family transposase n=1 Tax=Leptolyngbya ohadii TaxID=1962290 RepID=UPI000B5A0311|nr:IS701 family transposase [Leptolyngbya ohadii]
MVEPRAARPTLRFVDEYCEWYAPLFPEVRSFEAFKYLHVGMISELKRKTLPAIAKAVGLDNEQGLHHLLTKSPWSVTRLRQIRLKLILKLLDGQAVILLIDETGDCKKGKHTDYVKRQYIGNVGKKENGIVAVTAYALFRGMILPLSFEVYKPKERLKAGDEYKTKPQIAAEMIRELLSLGFRFELVLADSLYGESKVNFIRVLESLNLPYIVAIRSNHGMWLPQDQEVTCEPWQAFRRTFSNGKTEVRYRSEIIYGKRRTVRYWLLTTNPQTLPDNSTTYVMSNAPEVKLDEIGDRYGERTWIEYGLKQSKDALGWADFRVTHYKQIERWWEIVMSAFTMVSLFADAFNRECPLSHQIFAQHSWWNSQRGWKHLLNNLRLVIEPWIALNRLKPWLEVFEIPSFIQGFIQLIQRMQQFYCPIMHDLLLRRVLFNSA